MTRNGTWALAQVRLQGETNRINAFEYWWYLGFLERWADTIQAMRRELDDSVREIMGPMDAGL